MSFSDALAAVTQGKKAARQTWDKNTWLYLIPLGATITTLPPTAPPQKLAPWVAMHTSSGQTVPYQPNQFDLLSDNWKIVS